MVNISKNPENSPENSDNSFSFSDIDAGAFVPSHLFLFDLLEKNTINSTDFTIFLVIFNEAFFKNQGSLLFKLSNPEIRKRTGLSRYPVANALTKLESLDLIKYTIGKNGAPTTIEIRLKTIRKLNKKPHAQKEQGGHAQKEQGVAVTHAQKEQGAMLEKSTHLLTKLLKVSLSHENKFFQQSRRNAFKSDLKRLVAEGFDIDAIASFLETCDFERVKSFYGVIKSKKDSLGQIHEEFLNQKTENEAAERRRLSDRVESTMPEIVFRTPDAIANPNKIGNAFKGKIEPKNLMRSIDLSDFSAVAQNH